MVLNRLTADEIDNEIMVGTQEPSKSTAGRLLLVGSLVISIFTLPFFGESYSGCVHARIYVLLPIEQLCACRYDCAMPHRGSFWLWLRHSLT
jgi:hypothetical protein